MKFGDINWAALISGYKAEEKRQEEEKRKKEQEELNKRLIEARITGLTRPKEQDIGTTLMQILGGFKRPQEAMTPEQIVGGMPTIDEGGPVSFMGAGGRLTPEANQFIIDAISKQFGGITPEIARKGMLPAGIRALMPKAREKKRSPKIIGMIRKLKDVNAPREDIETAIRYEGEEPEDYIDEIGDYQPIIPKKRFFWRK